MTVAKAACIVLMSLVTAQIAEAVTVIGKSTGKRVQVIELYSSESCSSCPPADEWVSNLTKQEGLWTDFVPIVFHVDYWNYLNWKDGLSSNLMTKRQVEIANQWPQANVYTPGFVLNGKEWNGWRSSGTPRATEKSSVEISLEKSGNLNFTARVTFAPGYRPQKNHTVRIALLGNGIQTKITAGENNGRTLNHNFAVLDWAGEQLVKGSTEVHIKFNQPKQKTTRLAVVAWIEEDGNLTPLQAAGGYL